MAGVCDDGALCLTRKALGWASQKLIKRCLAAVGGFLSRLQEQLYLHQRERGRMERSMSRESGVHAERAHGETLNPKP